MEHRLSLRQIFFRVLFVATIYIAVVALAALLGVRGQAHVVKATNNATHTTTYTITDLTLTSTTVITITLPHSGIIAFLGEDNSCDYGRNPAKLWPDNDDGHPFERAFCDGLTEVNYKHPLDSLENEGLYCDEVPECWAYGLTQDGHH